MEFKLLWKDPKQNDEEGISSYGIEKVFPSSFFMIVIGKPGSGKTTIIEEMLLNTALLNEKFDYILIFSPYKLKNIPDVVENENFFQILDIEVLFNKISSINNNENAQNLLIILDDYVGYIHKMISDPRLVSLFYNRRHILKKGVISIIITSQKFILIPPQIRTCINSMIIFQLNQSEYQSIRKDVCAWLDIPRINKLLQNQYDFITFNLKDGYLYKNFKDRIL